MWQYVLAGALMGFPAGWFTLAMFSRGARADELSELRADHQQALEAARTMARKAGYDEGWDAAELLHRRKRQAAAQAAAVTRKRRAR